TDASVPICFWFCDFLHLHPIRFDRVINFGFGILLLYPMRVLIRRSAGAPETWAAWLAVAALAALSSFFEILEGIIAQIVRPDLGIAYLGTQGDIWDAQKDMTAAFAGAILATLLLLSAQLHRRNPTRA